MTTVTGLTAAAAILPVSVTTGSEARPDTPARVLWIGGSTRPSSMIDGDIWLREQSGTPSLPSFITVFLNTITQGVLFSQGILLNGTSPFTFSISAGALPGGLSLNTTTGVISGTPTSSGAYAFTVQATNAVGSTSQSFSGTITSTPLAPDITTTTLSSLTQGVAFNQTLTANGTGPLTWTISAGVLPSGLTLNSANGSITGTPTGSGAFSFTVQVSNTAGTDTQAFFGTIASTGTAPVITTTVLDALQAGFSFSQTLNKTGSTPMTWGVSAGTIPAGLSINSSTGVVSGTPTTAGSYSFTVSATNSFGSDTQVFTGSVDAPSSGTVYSVFGATAPFALTSYTDAATGSWLSHQYYSFAGDPALAAGSKIIGARLYVPSGSAHIGQTWYGALIRSLTGPYPSIGAFPYTQYDSNGSKQAGSPLVVGWNEVLFATEYDVVPAGGSWLIGIQIGDGTRYLSDSTFATTATKNLDGKNFYLTEFNSTGIHRTWYRNNTSASHSYGIDVLMRVT